MKTSYDIIKRPVITEASMAGIADKRYTFEVDKSATKIEIKNAVEEAFKVEVEKVNTIMMKSKPKRLGVHMGTTSAWKKAIVTLKADSKTIEFFDGMM
ncbi:MAG: 50S ribosomal protein L23 [Ruminococcaceae bacterium]|nr:50S ribosomal protein L23 [Oscillospiraceae bacterium]